MISSSPPAQKRKEDHEQDIVGQGLEAHSVRELPNGNTQLLIGTHLIHEVTSPQALAYCATSLEVLYPRRTFATVDYIVPTDETEEPYSDQLADDMIKALRKNCEEFGITFFDIPTGKQGIVHIVGPEQGIAARHDHCLRRLPHFDARGFWRHRVRHRHQSGPRRAGHPDDGHPQTQGPPHQRRK